MISHLSVKLSKQRPFIYLGLRRGISLSEQRQSEVQIRSVEKKLDKLFDLDPLSLQIERSLDERLMVNCRHISLLLAVFLKMERIPARARCGFAIYFTPARFEDHWVCEYWDGS
jgi:hypothetical protein